MEENTKKKKKKMGGGRDALVKIFYLTSYERMGMARVWRGWLYVSPQDVGRTHCGTRRRAHGCMG